MSRPIEKTSRRPVIVRLHLRHSFSKTPSTSTVIGVDDGTEDEYEGYDEEEKASLEVDASEDEISDEKVSDCDPPEEGSVEKSESKHDENSVEEDDPRYDESREEGKSEEEAYEE
jgi:hypothetical protein